MPNYYDALPKEADRVQLFNAVQRIIKAIKSDGGDFSSSSKISKRLQAYFDIAVTSDAITFFMKQDEKKPGDQVNNSTTLSALYNLITYRHHHFKESAKKAFYANRDALYLVPEDSRPPHFADIGNVSDAKSAVGTQHWVHATPSDVTKVAAKLEGSFFLLRKSTHSKNLIMKSEMHIAKRTQSKTPYLAASHIHFDKFQMPRVSMGYFFPVVNNIYAPLRIEGHEGLEVVVLRNPIQQSPQFFVGFMIGVNGDRTVYNSSVMLVNMNNASAQSLREMSSRFSMDGPEYAKLDADLRGRIEGILSEEKSRLISDLDI